MTKSIDFYFDFISPYSYLAYKKLISLKLESILNQVKGYLHFLCNIGQLIIKKCSKIKNGY